jgi:hypothetical protein
MIPIDNQTRVNDGCTVHCFHQKEGPVWMVVPDGHIVQECCRCHEIRVIHLDHAAHRNVARL